MAKRRELSEFDRGRIIGAFQFIHSHFPIATQLNIPLGTVKTIIRHFHANEAIPQPRTGRPRHINPQPDRQIACSTRRNINSRRKTTQTLTADINATIFDPISTRTFSRSLNEDGIGKRAAKHVFVTTPESRHLCLQYVTEHLDCNQEQWDSQSLKNSKISNLGPSPSSDHASGPACFHRRRRGASRRAARDLASAAQKHSSSYKES